MRLQYIAVAGLLAGLYNPAWAINKCTGPTGQVTFQDAPCATGTGGRIEVRPASGRAPESAAPMASSPGGSTTPPKVQQTEAQRLEKVLASSQAYRRRVDLESLLVPQAQGALYQTRARCDSELKSLHAQKSRANNNLAGATWEASLSQEMQAVSTRCDTQQRELKEEYESLRRECIGLGGCKPS